MTMFGNSSALVWRNRFAWALVILSVPVWCVLFIAPFLPVSVAERTAVAGIAVAAGEIMFWVGLALLGPELAAKLRTPKVNTGASYRGKRVGVVGATGGLGQSITQALIREGAQVVAFARDTSKLVSLQEHLSQSIPIDLHDDATIRKAASAAGELDALIVATGMDVRKPLHLHTQEDLDRQWTLNLRGPINVTKEFLKYIKAGGVVAHLGGFGDGRLALPYYSADVATRAGLAAFCESMNRELALEGGSATVAYLCPEPADTEAERPYRDLWTRMGTPPVHPDKVADFVLQSVLMKKTLAIMGCQTWFAAKANGLWTAFADLIGLRTAGVHLKTAFGSGMN